MTDQGRVSTEGELADVPDPAVVLEHRTVFRGMVWDVVADRVRFGRAGGEFVREYQDHPGAVAVLAFDDRDRILLINQYRHPIGTRDWELPAGLLDVPDEDPLAAAQRELAEEADLVAATWSAPHAIHPTPGGSNEVIHVFEARDLSPAPDAHERRDEEAEIVMRWVPLEEAVAAVLAGRLRNGPLQIAVLAAHARRS